MPRRAAVIRPIRREIYLDPKLDTVLKALFHDPYLEKAKHGQINAYVVNLIRRDLSARGLLSDTLPGLEK